MKYIHFYQSSNKIVLFLVLKTKNVLFYIIFKVFSFILYVCIRFNCLMFFSLVFVYTCLSILVYLQFTKFRLVFIWLTTQENKFREGVKQTGFTWNFLQPPMQMCESASIPLYKNQYALFLLLPVFQRFSKPPGPTKWYTNIFWVTSKSFRYN